jgi:hypothetical protein
MELAINIADCLAILSILIAFIVSLTRRNDKTLFTIQLYIIVSLIVNIFLEITEIIPTYDPTGRIASVVSNIYSLIEISLLLYFINGNLRGKGFRATLKILLLLYFSICLLIWTSKYQALFFIVPHLFGIENFLIVVACLFYFYEVLNSELVLNFKSDAIFIVTCGLLFYFSIMTPLLFSYFIWVNVAPELNQIVRIMNMMFYSILFISLMKAYLCPSPKQKQSQFFVL